MITRKDDMLFILWDSTKDGVVPRNGGEIATGGVLGHLTADNVYLRTYAAYPDARRPKDLEVGQSIVGVRFSLSGQRGCYDVVRVK